jgi:dihydrofolate synthase/folylpolyglutamate synthase
MSHLRAIPPEGGATNMHDTATIEFKQYADVRAWMAEQTDYEKMVRFTMKRGEFDLGRVERFFAALGAPQTGYECAHIAGTKGKGSSSIMLDSMIRAHGKSCGLYTSPHLERETERIRINGDEITEGDLLLAFRDMGTVLERFQRSGDSLTWFEIFTGAALVCFRRAKVELAVLETGLGGRLDATNAVTPLVTGITNIGHDHHDKLGDTLADIGYEKAGIIKQGIPLVTGLYDREGMDVVLARARDMNAPVRRYGKDFEARDIQPSDGGISYELVGAGYRHRKLVLPALGAIQAKNAAFAVEMLHQLWSQLGIGQPDEQAVRDGLAACALPGRCELFPGSPDIIIDVAHNGESIRQTVKTLAQRFGGRRLVMLVGLAKDKPAEEVVQELTQANPAAVVFTEYSSVRATPADHLHTAWQKLGAAPAVSMPDWNAALDHACGLAGPGGLVVVTGSFYLAGLLRGRVAMRTSAVVADRSAI